MGFDKMRSRIAIKLKGGKTIEGWADERYRGGPDNPLSDAALEAKVRSCCEGVLDEVRQAKLIETAWSVFSLSSDVERADEAHQRRQRIDCIIHASSKIHDIA